MCDISSWAALYWIQNQHIQDNIITLSILLESVKLGLQTLFTNSLFTYKGPVAI